METWAEADRELVSLRVAKAKMDGTILGWLLVALREQAHRQLGFGTFYEYVRSRLQVGKSQGYAWTRMTQRIGELPGLFEELAAGRLTFCAVKSLLQVANAHNERAWIEATKSQSVHAIEEMVAGRLEGDGPDSPKRPELLTVERTFELRSETDALLRQVKLALEQADQRPLSDDEVLSALARSKLAELQAGKKAGDVKAQVMMLVCPDCEGAWQLAAGREFRVSPEAFDHLDVRGVIELSGVGTDDRDAIPIAVQREVFIRDRGHCHVPGCTGTHFLEFHHLVWRSHGGKHVPSNLILLCSSHHLAFHQQRMLLEGTRVGELRFFHPDRQPYGELQAPA